jgi:HD-GYP domain-containing protein (c-di-GMP phosphodiesterase class II)
MKAKGPRTGLSRSPRRRGYRLLYPLLLLLVVTALVPLAAFAWNTIGANRDALTTSQQENQLQLASSVADRLDTYIDGFRRQLVKLAEAFAASRRVEGERRFLRRLKRGDLSDYLDDNLIALRFVPEKGGEIRAVSGGLALPEAAELPLQEGVAWVRQSDLASMPVMARDAHVSDPVLLGPDAVVCVVISTPVVTRSQLVGTLQGVLELETLWQRIVRENLTGNTLFAVSPAGELFAHTDKILVRHHHDPRGIEIVQRYLEGGGRSKETLTYMAPEPDHPVELLGSFETTREGWGIFVQVEKRLAYALVRQIVRDTARWALVALLVAIVVAVVFARTLTHPLARLTDASRRFAGGDFEARAEVRSGNEIGELAETFNGMMAAIRDYISRIRQAAQEANQMFLGTIRALAEAIDEKDAYTKGHSVRVNRLAVAVGREYGLSETELRDLHVSSLLHDVGKIGIDDAILKKPAALDEDEFEIMKSHPERGAKIMGQIPQMQNIVPGMRFHHERWAGGGYPLGLEGEEIPVQARIVAVADAFDAMTTDRPYQRAMTIEEAVARINDLKGTLLAPDAVEAFNRAYEGGQLPSDAFARPTERDGEPFEEGEIASPEELAEAQAESGDTLPVS